ncbi:hypothetical protein T4C_10714 [Trichinella pseudospiralis]|uniref:Uncharacterized protein n=1 Tax=Trichinella pseudospiralis TaxID=6337 RepID=A0A0V1K0D0_TRIPS|nr:hypothetical protein T4C_10714 [Trichinella pseudospiralis]
MPQRTLPNDEMGNTKATTTTEAQKLAHCSRLFTAHTFACLNSKHQSIRCVAFVNQRVGSGKPLCKLVEDSNQLIPPPSANNNISAGVTVQRKAGDKQWPFPFSTNLNCGMQYRRHQRGGEGEI